MNSVSGSQHGHHHFDGTHYVVSEDIDVLISRWSLGEKLSPPSEIFYQELRSRMKHFFEKLFAKVTFISSREIKEGLTESAVSLRRAGFTVISLERAYLEDSEIDGRIEITREVSDSGDDIVVHGIRHGTPRKSIQFQCLAGKGKIALVDDVVFSGKTLISTINDLHYEGANAHVVVAAVGVKDGIDRLKKANFGVSGMPDHLTVDCLEEFDDISDQVCERDFYPGVPYSGREIAGVYEASLPYMLPFGKPGKWASIPEKEIKRFSELCLDNTIALFEEMERINGIKISLPPRPVFGFSGNGRFVDFLARKREEISL